MEIEKKDGGFIFKERQIPHSNRDSCFVNTGSDYGVGKTQPVGKFKASNEGAIPQKSYAQDPYEKTYF